MADENAGSCAEDNSISATGIPHLGEPWPAAYPVVHNVWAGPEWAEEALKHSILKGASAVDIDEVLRFLV
jgi:hypothetical protein